MAGAPMPMHLWTRRPETVPTVCFPDQVSTVVLSGKQWPAVTMNRFLLASSTV